MYIFYFSSNIFIHLPVSSNPGFKIFSIPVTFVPVMITSQYDRKCEDICLQYGTEYNNNTIFILNGEEDGEDIFFYY
jgi:hypothetical protein